MTTTVSFGATPAAVQSSQPIAIDSKTKTTADKTAQVAKNTNKKHEIGDTKNLWGKTCTLTENGWTLPNGNILFFSSKWNRWVTKAEGYAGAYVLDENLDLLDA